MTPPDLKWLKAGLDALARLTSLDVGLIGRLYRQQAIEAFTRYLDRCKSFQTTRQELSQIFLDAADEDWPNRLRRIDELCENNGFDTFDIKKLQSKLREETATLSRWKKAYEKLDEFAGILPESATFGIPELARGRKLVSETPREVLALRNEITADPAAAVVMKRAGQQGRNLLERRDELRNIISTTTNISTADLSEYAVTILGAGALRFFSSKYQSAKRAYLSISRRESFNKKLAAKDIRALVEWQKDEQNFRKDPQVATLFGSHFQGVSTDFDLFDRLLAFYEDVERNFSGAENQKIGRFLKTAALDLLMSIPDIDGEIGPNTFGQLGKEIEPRTSILSNFRQALEELESLIIGFKDLTRVRVSELSGLAQQVDAQSQLKACLDHNQEMKTLLGTRFHGAATDWEKFETDTTAARTIVSIQNNSGCALDILEKGRAQEALTAFRLIIQKDADAEAALTNLSRHTGINVTQFSGDRTPAEIAEYLKAASEDKDGLYLHSEYAVARRDLEEAGFDWVVAALSEAGLPLHDLGAIPEAVVIRALAIQVFKVHGRRLGCFRGKQLDELRTRFAALDREIIKMSRNYLRTKTRDSARHIHGNGVGRKSNWTEMALIQNEISKKQRFIPVRDLTTRARGALLELKPCWMMSPLAVAQYLPHGEQRFDLCIIDEASQMPPEDSLGALARSRQAVVVGDTNQLPPTSFFRKMIEDEDADDDETVLDESILEMANAAFRPLRRLRWHYRSRHSALIKFSNHMVYHDDLVVFPSAMEARVDMGVSLVPVRGRYRSSTNGDEARAMIDATLRFMRISPDRSLGIVTLNQKQRDLLLEEMEYALNQDKIVSRYVDQWAEKNDGLEPFFIKNLENVQGDERDVIFIGTVYGPEEPDGPVMQRFGPINGLAGKRRLNVLFSRAKQQIVTFSSMVTSDIRAEEKGNPGAYMLKRWLEYSATGLLPAGKQTYREPDSDFEIFVVDQIRSMGFEPVPQVGVAGHFIDIGVRHADWPHGFIMGVECDGESYHSSKSARDRDRLRQEVLEGLGWHLHRIWSIDWFNNAQKEAKELRRAINARLDWLKNNAALFAAPVQDEPRSLSSENLLPDATDSSLAVEPVTSTPAAGSLKSETHTEGTDPRYIAVGDTVRVRYLSGTEPTLEITLSDEINVPDHGIVHTDRPLGQALLGAEESDEIDVLVGNFVREAVIERVIKGQQ